jgi:hypothetical protein
MYWCCAQVEPRRERLASYCLGLAGYEIYQPLLREQRRSRHGSRKIIVTPPLFPGYLFVWVVRGWWDARWSPGVVRLIMDGLLLRAFLMLLSARSGLANVAGLSSCRKCMGSSLACG